MTISPADSTLVAIRKKVRRLTASASENSLSTADIDQYIQTFYTQDFPYSIKLDQMRNVFTFFTEPNRDRYPLDVNNQQSLRAPIYVDGLQGYFTKDRQQFHAVWPNLPTKWQPINGDGTTVNFSFKIPAPFLSKEVVLGGVDANGNPISVNDDGNGVLLLQVPNPVVTVPLYTDVYEQNTPGTPQLPSDIIGKPIPGMHNQNTLNPGLNNTSTQTTPPALGIGSVNYVSGQFVIKFPVAPANGSRMTLWVSQYQTGRPYSVLFWNNEITIRPVPKIIHKVEIETYQTPVQFMQSSDSPLLAQWWQLIAIGAAIKVLEDRQDMDGVQALVVLYDRQEDLVLERQANEEIFQPNQTIFNSANVSQGAINGIGYW